MAKKYSVATLGCRTNQYETQAYRDQLEAMGYVAAKEGEKADVCLVNTCTVTETADRDSRHQIRRFAERHPGTQLVVTGCSADNRPDEIAAIPGVTKVVVNKEKESLIQQLFPDEEVPEFKINHFEAHTRAFVKVQDGCNSFCTYCIIPYVRGRSRSRSVESVIKEVEGLIENGYKEVVLTGINIGDYDGGDGKVRLVDLVRAVDGVAGLKRLRLSSIDPDEVDGDLADAVLNGKTTCHSMHIVLQSGSNAILKRMNRKYTRQIFLNTIHFLRQKSPHFTFTTDIIVGFPGETERDFEESIEVMRETQFAKVHMFPYSERKRTRAALYPNKVPTAVMQKRKALLLQEAEQVAYDMRHSYVGKTHAVLIEQCKERSFGHTDNFLPVWIDRRDLKQHDLVQVQLVGNSPEGLIGS